LVSSGIRITSAVDAMIRSNGSWLDQPRSDACSAISGVSVAT